MRLIDADALMEKYNLKDATKYGNRDAEQQNRSYSTMMLYEVADMLEDAPTIEAAPVVHGKWISDLDANGKLKSVWRGCSVCGCLNHSTKPNFCPNCGAKMDGKVV